MDHLFDADRAALLTDVVLAVAQRFGLRFDELHNDSTSISFCGNFRNATGRTDLLAIMPLMYANSLAPRYDVRIWQLPEHGSRYDVHMVWHQTAGLDLAHSWLRGVVRKLFQRQSVYAA